MTNEETKEIFESILDAKSQFDDYGIEATEYNLKVSKKFFDGLEVAVKALETLEEFEKAQIITGGRLNGRTYAYKCGLEDGKRKALEQEPCEDCISRKAVLEIAKSSKSNWIDNSVLFKRVNELPPVTPKPKTDVLDKIRAEIKQLTITKGGDDYVRQMAELFSLKRKVLQIIDKYKAESEEV